jgi:hypothetical protein
MRGVSGEEYPIGRAIFEQTYTLDTTPPAAQPAPVQPVQQSQSDVEPVVWADALFDAIKHGDAEHQNWLQEKLKSWVIVNPPPTPPAAPVQPVAMRMPKVGDRVVCIDDESLGTVVYLTAGGSPEIKFDDGSHGTYMLREFAELFGYTTPPAAQEIVCSTGLCHYKPAAPVQKSLTELQKDAANLLFALHDAWPYVHHHCTIESKRKEIQALMVKHGDFADLQPPAAQRQWVGLTDDERGKVYADWRWSDGRTSNLALCEAIEAKLKELNT